MGSQPDHSTGRWAGLRLTLPSSDSPRQYRLACRRLGRIRPAVIRGQLCYVIVGVAFTSFAKAAAAWAAVEADHLAIAELTARSAVSASLLSGGQGVS